MVTKLLIFSFVNTKDIIYFFLHPTIIWPFWKERDVAKQKEQQADM